MSKKITIKKQKSKSFFNKIILENFKGYKDFTEVELSNGVNLIYGMNSAGKSSIIQSLRLMRQSIVPNNLNVPLVPLSSNSNQGNIQFPEGIDGLIHAKEKNSEMKLGLEIQNFFSNQNQSTEKIVYGFKSPKNKKDNFPDFMSILFESKRFKKDQIKLSSEEKIKLSLSKKNWFKPQSKFGNLLAEMSKHSLPLPGSEIGYNFGDQSKNIIDNDFFYENAKIEYINLHAINGVYEETFLSIPFGVEGSKKYRDKKNLSSEDKNNIHNLNKKSIENYIKKTILSKKSKDFETSIDQDKNLIDKNRIKKLLKFLKSKEFGIKEKFQNFFLEDIKKNSHLVRFKDQIFDNKVYEKFMGKQKKYKFRRTFLRPDNYLINIIHAGMDEARAFLPQFEFHKIYQGYRSSIKNLLSQILVIPGLRQLPERYYKRGLQTSFVGTSGENIGELIYNSKARENVNKWFKILDIPYTIRSRIEHNYFVLELQPIGEKYWISYRDVGLGYSLSLTFILTCLLESNKCILVEEPEVHLHPKLQGDIMDLLLYSALERGNQFIVETHSENMLFRAQKCIRKGKTSLNPYKKDIKISSQDLGINNVYRVKNESTVQKIELDSKGDFRTHWKDGFFSERLDDLF